MVATAVGFAMVLVRVIAVAIAVARPVARIVRGLDVLIGELLDTIAGQMPVTRPPAGDIPLALNINAGSWYGFLIDLQACYVTSQAIEGF